MLTHARPLTHAAVSPGRVKQTWSHLRAQVLSQVGGSVHPSKQTPAGCGGGTCVQASGAHLLSCSLYIRAGWDSSGL